MGVKERMMAIRLMGRLNEHPEEVKRLGIEVVAESAENRSKK